MPEFVLNGGYADASGDEVKSPEMIRHLLKKSRKTGKYNDIEKR